MAFFAIFTSVYQKKSLFVRSYLNSLTHICECLHHNKIPAHSSKTAFTHDSGSSSACWALLCWNWSDKLLLLTGQQVSLAREQSAPPPLTVCTVLLPSCGHRDRGSAAAGCSMAPCYCCGGGGTHSTCVTSQSAAYLLLLRWRRAHALCARRAISDAVRHFALNLTRSWPSSSCGYFWSSQLSFFSKVQNVTYITKHPKKATRSP